MIYELLWTGGFDSTFRLCQLAREECVVQPYYVVHPLRNSVGNEMEAHRRILSWLGGKGVKAEIRPVKYVRFEDVPDNLSVSDAYARIRKTWDIGGQYEWLARFAVSRPGVELCHEGFVNRQGTLGKLIDTAVKREDALGRVCVDTEKSDRDLSLVFGSYSFPVIGLNNVQMLGMLKEWGMDDVVGLVSFCDSGLGENCGVCVSCRGKFSTGIFDDLFTEKAKRRYRIYNFFGGLRYVSPFFARKGGARFLQWMYFLYVMRDMGMFNSLLRFDPSVSWVLRVLFGRLEGLDSEGLEKFFPCCVTERDLFLSVGFDICGLF